QFARVRFEIDIAISSRGYRFALTPTLSLREREALQATGEGVRVPKNELKLLRQAHQLPLCLLQVRLGLTPRHAHSCVCSSVRQFQRPLFRPPRSRQQSFVCLTKTERQIARVRLASPSRAKRVTPRLNRPCRPSRSRRKLPSNRGR